jgi:hypothetical protein
MKKSRVEVWKAPTAPIFEPLDLSAVDRRRGRGVDGSRRRPAANGALASFRLRSQPAHMTDAEQLMPAKPEDLAAAFYALQFDGRRPTRRADEVMAGIVAGI